MCYVCPTTALVGGIFILEVLIFFPLLISFKMTEKEDEDACDLQQITCLNGRKYFGSFFAFFSEEPLPRSEMFSFQTISVIKWCKLPVTCFHFNPSVALIAYKW